MCDKAVSFLGDALTSMRQCELVRFFGFYNCLYDQNCLIIDQNISIKAPMIKSLTILSNESYSAFYVFILSIYHMFLIYEIA